MEPKIQKTMNYDLFKLVEGNRRIFKHHVLDLANSIAEKDLLAYNPIIVNPQMEVIDGQHRLEAAKQLNKYIYYVVAPTTELQDVRRLNAYLKNWKSREYINSYAEVGNEDYIALQQFCEVYLLPITVSAALLGGYKYSKQEGLLTHIKNGHFKVTEAKRAEKFADYLLQLIPFSAPAVVRSRDFIYALRELSEEKSVKFLKRLKETHQVISRQFSTRGYQQEIEEVLNS